MHQELFVSKDTNEVFISGVSNGNPIGNRITVSNGNFIYCILEWAKGQDVNKTGQIVLTHNDKEVALINLNKTGAQNE